MTGFIARLAAANQDYKSLDIAFTVLGGICVGFFGARYHPNIKFSL